MKAQTKKEVTAPVAAIVADAPVAAVVDDAPVAAAPNSTAAAAAAAAERAERAARAAAAVESVAAAPAAAAPVAADTVEQPLELQIILEDGTVITPKSRTDSDFLKSKFSTGSVYGLQFAASFLANDVSRFRLFTLTVSDFSGVVEYAVDDINQSLLELRYKKMIDDTEYDKAHKTTKQYSLLVENAIALKIDYLNFNSSSIKVEIDRVKKDKAKKAWLLQAIRQADSLGLAKTHPDGRDLKALLMSDYSKVIVIDYNKLNAEELQGLVNSSYAALLMLPPLGADSKNDLVISCNNYYTTLHNAAKLALNKLQPHKTVTLDDVLDAMRSEGVTYDVLNSFCDVKALNLQALNALLDKLDKVYKTFSTAKGGIKAGNALVIAKVMGNVQAEITRLQKIEADRVKAQDKQTAIANNTLALEKEQAEKQALALREKLDALELEKAEAIAEAKAHAEKEIKQIRDNVVMQDKISHAERLALIEAMPGAERAAVDKMFNHLLDRFNERQLQSLADKINDHFKSVNVSKAA